MQRPRPFRRGSFPTGGARGPRQAHRSHRGPPPLPGGAGRAGRRRARHRRDDVDRTRPRALQGRREGRPGRRARASWRRSAAPHARSTCGATCGRSPQVLTQWGFLAALGRSPSSAADLVHPRLQRRDGRHPGRHRDAGADGRRSSARARSPTCCGTMALQPPPAIGAFLIGFTAKRASWLGGLLYGIFVDHRRDRGAPDARRAACSPADELVRRGDHRATPPWSPVGAALFASAAAWYRRFLDLANPNRGQRSRAAAAARSPGPRRPVEDRPPLTRSAARPAAGRSPAPACASTSTRGAASRPGPSGGRPTATPGPPAAAVASTSGRTSRAMTFTTSPSRWRSPSTSSSACRRTTDRSRCHVSGQSVTFTIPVSSSSARNTVPARRHRVLARDHEPAEAHPSRAAAR